LLSGNTWSSLSISLTLQGHHQLEAKSWHDAEVTELTVMHPELRVTVHIRKDHDDILSVETFYPEL
jgi:hypothetical protein